MLVLAAACDAPGVKRNFGLPANDRIEAAEATSEYRVTGAARALVNAPHALLVLERDLGSSHEQRITLPNATSFQGENVLMLRAQTASSASRTSLSLAEMLPRFGGAPAPFNNITDADLMVSEDRYGSFVYTSRRMAEGQVCVLAMRRADTGARPPPRLGAVGLGGGGAMRRALPGARPRPRGSTALDMMLRNCVHGSVAQALAPIGEAAFGLGTPLAQGRP
ncbi:MAG: hypothetical protein JJU42_13675 [Rhodobacteraceae bacterium]|nr:hypothetical protein [Paracoccaceae bacterium]